MGEISVSFFTLGLGLLGVACSRCCFSWEETPEACFDGASSILETHTGGSFNKDGSAVRTDDLGLETLHDCRTEPIEDTVVVDKTEGRPEILVEPLDGVCSIVEIALTSPLREPLLTEPV